MMITLAQSKDKQEIARIDCHVPPARLEECIGNGQIYILKDGSDSVVGLLRYSFFWQTIPFLDLIYLEESYRGKGLGKEMMRKWEGAMKIDGYGYVMTSTQSDENAWRFYEKIGYRRIGGFFPPEQEAEEWMYLKELE